MILTSFNGKYSGSEWIEFYSDENTIHKCPRDQYLEMREFFIENEEKQNFRNYINWEPYLK